MVHRNLTFTTLTSIKHTVAVYRSRSQQRLYVSTPLHPGALNPSLPILLLSQIVAAFKDAQLRDEKGAVAPPIIRRGPSGTDPEDDEDAEDDEDRDHDETKQTGTKRKGTVTDKKAKGSRKRSRIGGEQQAEEEDIQAASLPLATLTVEEQQEKVKVGIQ